MVERRNIGRLFLGLKLARLHFLLPGFLLYLLGFSSGVLRGGERDLSIFIFGYAIFFLAHLSVSFSNDYFDREGDKLGKSNALSGGSGVLVQHPELERFALLAAIFLICASIALAGIFTITMAFPIAFFAYSVVGALLGWFYSAPPLRFSQHGLGEVTTATAAGLVMPGLGYYVSLGSMDLWFLVLAAPLLCFGLFFILTVEMPDMEADIAAGKRNFITRYGTGAGGVLSLFSAALGTLLLSAWAITGAMGDAVSFQAMAIFSLMPLAAAVLALAKEAPSRAGVLRRARMNFTALMLFIIAVDASLVLAIA